MAEIKQTCTTCPHIQKCWATHTNADKPISKQNVMINLLVCRLQLGIKRNQAAANLIQIYKPGIMRLINNARQMSNDPNLDTEQLFNDMSSTMIELLLHDYKIGDRGRATPYLFDPQQGFLTKWIKWMLNKSRRFYLHHELMDQHGDDSSNDENMDGYEEGDSDWASPKGSHGYLSLSSEKEERDISTEFSNQLLGIIEDGYTLNSNEYRVIKFCLHNGNEMNSTRHIDGLHIILAKIMSVSRPRVTRLYKRAKEKIKARYAELSEDI